MAEVNIGKAGGDLPARRFALAVTATLTILAMPQLQITDSTLKLAALLAAMSGALFLMAGLVFLQKTHFAGIMLIPSAIGMMLVAQMGSRLGAMLIGVLFCAMIVSNLITRRCELNRLLGIRSCG